MIKINVVDYIDIRDGKELRELSKVVKIDYDLLKEKVMDDLLKANLLSDSSDEWGKTIGEILSEQRVNAQLASIFFLSTSQREAVENYIKLKVISPQDDCVDCGALLQEYVVTPGWTQYVCTHCNSEWLISDKK